jgi:hypothetical protein
LPVGWVERQGSASNIDSASVTRHAPEPVAGCVALGAPYGGAAPSPTSLRRIDEANRTGLSRLPMRRICLCDLGRGDDVQILAVPSRAR